MVLYNTFHIPQLALWKYHNALLNTDLYLSLLGICLGPSICVP